MVTVPEVELVVKNIESIKYPAIGRWNMFKLYSLLAERLSKYPIEHSFVMYMNMGDVPLCFMEIGIGNPERVAIEARTILQGALSCNATKMIVFHNHPSGMLKPSELDIQLTDCLVKTCNIFSMQLVDHVICGCNKDEHHKAGYYSMQYKQVRRIFPKNVDTLYLKGCVKKEDQLNFSSNAKAVAEYLKADFVNDRGTYPVRMINDLNEYVAEKKS